MFQRKIKRFRRRPNGRNNMSRNPQSGMRTNHFVNSQSRNNFRTSMSAEKSLEKYSSLAKEAMSIGDKTLSENYLQHADHYIRIIEDKNKNRIQARDNIIDKPIEKNKGLSEENNTDKNNIDQSKEIKNKV